MLILLPPSEGKSVPRRGAPLDLAGLSFRALTDARERTLDALIDLCAGEDATSRATGVLGLGPSQHDLVAANGRLRSAPTTRADRLYTGVLYDALDLSGLDPAARRRAARWLAVQSALFGLVRPGDRIPAYRLSGDTALPGLGRIAAHWRGSLGPVLEDAVGSGLLVDLRSTTYAAFWRPPAELAGQVATVRVLHESDGRRQVVSHFNKATKGRLVRDLLCHGSTPRRPHDLAVLLRDLGWTVEETIERSGSRLDVVVTAL